MYTKLEKLLIRDCRGERNCMYRSSSSLSYNVLDIDPENMQANLNQLLQMKKMQYAYFLSR